MDVCDMWGCPIPFEEDEEDEKERIAIDEDDDEIGAEWDEMSQWDLDGDEPDDDEEQC